VRAEPAVPEVVRWLGLLGSVAGSRLPAGRGESARVVAPNGDRPPLSRAVLGAPTFTREPSLSAQISGADDLGRPTVASRWRVEKIETVTIEPSHWAIADAFPCEEEL
jgi:hypothetical protein